MPTVNFSEVGASKRSWTAKVKELTHATLVREIKENAALMSEGIDFTYDEEKKAGEIYVGQFRRVGHFYISQDNEIKN